MQKQPTERHRIVIPLYDHTTEAEARELAEELERVFGLSLAPRVEGYTEAEADEYKEAVARYRAWRLGDEGDR